MLTGDTFKEAGWQEALGLRPVLRIMMDACDGSNHGGAPGDGVPAHHSIRLQDTPDDAGPS